MIKINRRDIPPDCICGCKSKVKWNIKKDCWNRFIHGHNGKGEKRDKEIIDKITSILKVRMKDPEIKKNQSNGVIKKWEDPEYRNKQMAATNNIEVKKKRSKGQKIANKKVEVIEKRSKASTENWKDLKIRKKRIINMIIKTNTPEIKLKRAKSTRNTWENPNIRKNRLEKMIEAQNRPEVKLKTSKATQKRWQDPEYAKKVGVAMNIKPNKPETIILNLLNEIYPNEWEYTGDFSFMIAGKNPDFTNKEQKKLIELYGDYWHRGQNPQNRIDHFKPHGYDTLVIWECELKDLDNVIEKIQKFNRVKGGASIVQLIGNEEIKEVKQEKEIKAKIKRRK
jgi:hypothetical protein